MFTRVKKIYGVIVNGTVRTEIIFQIIFLLWFIYILHTVYSRVRWFSNFSSAVYRYLELSLYFSSAVHWYLEISLYIFSVFSENNEKRLIHAQE